MKYTRERAADIQDIGERILGNLQGKETDVDFQALPVNTILFAHDLKPSDTARIGKGKVVAFVTETGGKTSICGIREGTRDCCGRRVRRNSSELRKRDASNRRRFNRQCDSFSI